MNKIQQLLIFLKDQPDDPFLNHALALEYIKIQEFQKAQQLFEKILTIHPTYIGSYYHLSKLLEDTNQRDLAEAYFKKGLEVAKQINDTHSFNELQSAYNTFMME